MNNNINKVNAYFEYFSPFFTFIFFHFNLSMIFDDVTIHVLCHVSSTVCFIIIKSTLFVAVNNFFIFWQRHINFILNSFIQLIQFNNYFLYFLHFVNIICCILCVFLFFSYVFSLYLFCLKQSEKVKQSMHMYPAFSLIKILQQLTILWLWKFPHKRIGIGY